jgi:hypothetical protein
MLRYCLSVIGQFSRRDVFMPEADNCYLSLVLHFQNPHFIVITFAYRSINLDYGNFLDIRLEDNS